MLSLAQVLRRYHLRIDLTSGGRDLAVVESRPVKRRGGRESPVLLESELRFSVDPVAPRLALK